MAVVQRVDTSNNCGISLHWHQQVLVFIEKIGGTLGGLMGVIEDGPDQGVIGAGRLEGEQSPVLIPGQHRNTDHH